MMPFVDNATHNARLAGLPNPDAWIWDEIHGPAGPPGWDPVLYWPWQNCKILLSFIPARMQRVPDRAIVVMYRENVPGNLPLRNPLGFQPASLAGIFSYCCGPCRANGCPIGERLAGICSHGSTVLYVGCVLPQNLALFQSTHRSIQLIDRRNPVAMDLETVMEVN